MAHRSRLAGFIIDCKRGSLESSADFWSQALGLEVQDYNEGGEGMYAPLSDGPAAIIGQELLEAPALISQGRADVVGDLHDVGHVARGAVAKAPRRLVRSLGAPVGP